jgi:hypothetical protein
VHPSHGSAQLDTLLGLKHNLVMVLETHAARKGAEATRKQGLVNKFPFISNSTLLMKHTDHACFYRSDYHLRK